MPLSAGAPSRIDSTRGNVVVVEPRGLTAFAPLLLHWASAAAAPAIAPNRKNSRRSMAADATRHAGSGSTAYAPARAGGSNLVGRDARRDRRRCGALRDLARDGDR